MILIKDVNAQLSLAVDTLSKITTEVVALEASLENIALPPDAEANLNRLTSMVNAIQAILTPVADVVTLDTIANQSVGVGAGPQTVPLTGVGSNAKNPTMTVSAVASDTLVIPSVSASLDTPPAPTGSLVFTPGSPGVATITVTINDGVSNVAKMFTVTVA